MSHPEPGDFGPVSSQHERLHKAAWLNRNAALMSASWGRFQVMGYNYALAGYYSLQDFVSAMYKSEGEHLLAFVQYLKNLSMDEDLRSKDWESFAFKYKSPEDRSDYVQKLKLTFEKYTE
ncbi:N-acetylmuramidase domain-containing protein [Niabella hibiscisoli]|uniref:N-acetylmuramidase domain-containing protein n=1 Tax=Niabella hibiscisoli TaxID=1825928 RepID=UPI001F10CDDB|nr:N-acetylmuramidase domain-containing protein [Niabella hibiscisoli]MCH5720872.1 N-acetylmuramidase family protein [Niabella hibiscisoli]